MGWKGDERRRRRRRRRWNKGSTSSIESLKLRTFYGKISVTVSSIRWLPCCSNFIGSGKSLLLERERETRKMQNVLSRFAVETLRINLVVRISLEEESLFVKKKKKKNCLGTAWKSSCIFWKVSHPLNFITTSCNNIEEEHRLKGIQVILKLFTVNN